MKISHVIRGEEHLSNTPYHLMLIDALGYERPIAYAHMPLILAKDGTKMSKRKHPETNLALYRDQGYLPEALINYLALLGWNPGTEQEIFTMAELERKIDPKRFVRIHRSILLNLDWVEQVNARFGGQMNVSLKDAAKTQLPVARDRMRALKERLEL